MRWNQASEVEQPHGPQDKQWYTPGQGDSQAKSQQVGQSAYAGRFIGFKVRKSIGDVHSDAESRTEGHQPEQQGLPVAKDGPRQERKEGEIQCKQYRAYRSAFKAQIIGQSQSLDKQAQHECGRPQEDNGNDHHQTGHDRQSYSFPWLYQAAYQRLFLPVSGSVKLAVAVVVDGAYGHLRSGDREQH